MILGLLYYFPYSESFFLGLVGQKCRNVVRCGWRARRGTYDWQAKAMPQMGRQRNTPSKRTTLTCSSHQPLSSPCLNEDSTIWGEGGKGGREGYGLNQNKGKGGGRPRRRVMGAAPKLMAHGQIMEVTNKEKKATERQDKNHSDVLKTCHDWQKNAK